MSVACTSAGMGTLNATSAGDPPGPPKERPPQRDAMGLVPASQPEPIITDRPDFTESAFAVPVGRLQLEGGYTFSYDDEDGERVSDQTLPEFLLRIGVVEDFELRLGWTGWSLTETLWREKNDAGRTVSRIDHDDRGTDMIVGVKYHFLDQRGLVPDFGVIAEMSLPTGASTKTSGDVDPAVKLLWGYELSERFSLTGNVNLSVPTSGTHRFLQTAASVSLGVSLTESMGAYVEYFGFYPNDIGTDCAHSLNAGLTFPITNDLQFDVRAGFGLNDEADDFFTGAGFAIRF